MRTTGLACVMGWLALAGACGDGTDSDLRDSGKENMLDAGGMLPGDSGAGTSSAVCGCKASEGCLRLNVLLNDDSPNLPWKLWPEQNLGEGRLFAGVYGPSAGSNVKYDDVKLSSGFDKRSFDLCVTPSSNLRAFCFLDDKADGEVYPPGTSVTGSGDYRDTCTMERQLSVTVVANELASLSCTLANSCD